tara:strand:+ start:225 stop:965 length:741 start_codon:yes stop_codon:yes gene_type:complete
MERLINIYVLNLIKREDRLIEIKNRIKKLIIPKNFSLNVIELKSIKPESTSNTLKSWTNFNNEDLKKVTQGNCKARIKKWWSREVSAGEKGCFESHLNAIKKINNNPAEVNLILEDDANFNENLLTECRRLILEINAHKERWNMLFLGNTSNIDFYKKVSKNIQEFGYSFNAHAYLVNSNNIKNILSIDYSNKIIAYDEFIPACGLSHPREEINKLYVNKKTKINIYRSRKNLSWQEDINKKSDTN